MDTSAQLANPIAQVNAAAAANPLTNPAPIAFNANNFQVPNVNSYIQDAWNQLAPYYSALLAEAGGDVNRAIERLKTDYTTGVRYTTEDVARETGYTIDDLNSSLSSLGVQTKLETASKLDSLNQRGMALTEKGGTQGGDASASLNVATEGEGGYEMGMLSTDQNLRKEAIQRSANQKLTDIGISGTRSIDQAGKTQTRGIEDATRQYQQTGEQLQQQREQEALGIATTKESEAIAAQQLALQKAQIGSITGGGSGSTNTRSHINPATNVWDDNYYAHG